MPGWTAGELFSRHNRPAFAPNLLNLLADMGVQAGDFAEIERLLDAMLAHQEPTGRFPSYDPVPGTGQPVWKALLCDSHAVLEVLVRYGRAHDPQVQAGLERMAADITGTANARHLDAEIRTDRPRRWDLSAGALWVISKLPRALRG